MKEALYIVQRFTPSGWAPTWWTNKNSPVEDKGQPPTPVPLSQTLEALKRAQNLHSEISFRIYPVAERQRQRKCITPGKDL